MRPPWLRPKLRAGALALAGALAPAAAHGAIARGDHPIVVLESYVGARPGNADALLAPLRDELEQRGFAARPAAVVELAGDRAPRPGVLDPGTTAADITQPAESGYEAYTRGRFAEAEAQLKVAIERIHRNPALLVLDTNNLEATFKVLAALALSQARRGDTGGSVATMIELIRTFRSQPITRVAYGPDAEQFYRAVARQVLAGGRGELSVSVSHDQAVIFVDGQIRGLGKAALADLIPGVYRVFVQVPATAGRQYEVEVTAGQRTALRIDWELDSSLWLTDRWVGFVFATAAERGRLAGFAATLLRRWGAGAVLAVVGTAELDGQPAIAGELYDATGRRVRGGAIGLGRDPDSLRALAGYLSDGTARPGVRVFRDGATAMATATAMAMAIDSGGGGGGGGGLRRVAPRLLVGAGAAVLVAGGVLYALDQDPGGSSAVYRNTAPAGIACGAAGAAAIAIGLWLWRTRGTPTVAFGSSGGFIGWGGVL